jgi:arylformamidase
VDMRGESLVTVEDLGKVDLRDTPRILFKTDAWVNTHIFPTIFPLLDATLPAYLKARGVVLVGMDVPSVDAMESKDLTIHHALHDCGITILESLRLQEVPPGIYELIALPLKLVGADGAPVRAILKERG